MAKRLPPTWVLIRAPKRIAWPGIVTSEVPQGDQTPPVTPTEETP